jgi:hypothetical protein
MRDHPLDNDHQLDTDRRIQERRDREVARRRTPRAEPDGRPSYRDPTANAAVGNVMRAGRRR